MPRSCHLRGFTIIELMVVVAVLGVIAAFAAPSFSDYIARSRLNGAANEAYSDLQYARSEAVQRYTPVRITFSSTGYVVEIASSGEDLRSVTWSNGTSGSTNMVATFDPVRGTAVVANGPTVLSNSGTGASARLNVNGAGRPVVCAVSGLLGGMKTC
jgi:prepilin-type N-terminal cleavage/methylation domain-containing protein